MAVCLCVPAALGGALLTQGSNELGLSGQLDTSGVAGTDLDLKVVVVNLEDAEGQALLKGDPGEAAAKERELVQLQTKKKELEQALGKL